MKRSKNQTEVLELTGVVIDDIAEKITEFMRELKMEKKNILRTRISMEEILLRWLDRFGEGVKFTFSMGYTWRMPFISLELKGEVCNPLLESEDDEDGWSNMLLTNIGLAPKYSYDKGKNIIYLKLERHKKNPALILVIAIFIASILGLLQMQFLPTYIQEFLLTAILWPLHNAFFRILNLISGPVIFLSVLASVYEVGNMATLGDMWKKMVARFVGFSFLITILSAFACVPVYSLEMNQVFLSDSEFSSILDLILNIVPNDVVTPILTGASPSIILLALVFAAALLIMGKQSTAVTAVITQLNSIMLMIMEWVNSLVAFFVIIMVLTHLWSGSLMILIGIWQPILAALVICVLILLFVAISICIREKVSLVLLFKKLRPSFIISFKTASTSESLGENVTCCEKKLGINHLITNFGIPLGTAIYMPGLSVAFLVVICYMAKQYDVVVTPMWIIMAIILTTILAIATPPIAGIGLMGHVALFAQLGIPSEALAVAMIADILIGFIASPFNQMLLQFELLSEASKMKLLNKDILKNKKAV